MTAQQRVAYRRLFKNHGSAIGYWEGWVEDDTLIMQYAKKMDGKVTRKTAVATAKNIGRSNETTPFEQAQLELDSRANKQLDKGYVTTQEEAKLPSTNAMGLEKPMLAQTFEKVKPEEIDWENAYAQAKLDGHRAMFKNGQLYSRQGKPIDLPHVIEAIKSAGLEDLHLDGELYVHGLSLQDISGLVKRSQPASKNLTFYMYDVVSEGDWRSRVEQIEIASTVNLLTQTNALLPLRAVKVSTFEELQKHHDDHLAAGFEGTMLRWGTQGYQDGKRSKHLLKLKNFQDAEFKIIGVNQGTPNQKDGVIYEVPVWICEVPGTDLTFTCTAQGNMYEKHNLWVNRKKHIGFPLTVKFHYYSKDGIPQLPVALRFPEYI